MISDICVDFLIDNSTALDCVSDSDVVVLVQSVLLYTYIKVFSARQHNAERAICYHSSVSLCVCQTGGSVKNG